MNNDAYYQLGYTVAEEDIASLQSSLDIELQGRDFVEGFKEAFRAAFQRGDFD